MVAAHCGADDESGGCFTAFAAMKVGDHVIWNGRLYVLRGVEPMSLPGRQAELEDAETGERIRVAVEELKSSSGEGYES